MLILKCKDGDRSWIIVCGYWDWFDWNENWRGWKIWRELCWGEEWGVGKWK